MMLNRPEAAALEQEFRMAYIGVVMERLARRLDNAGTRNELEQRYDGYVLNFGPMLQYQVSVTFAHGVLTEQVTGVKGDFCTRLTEEIEEALSQPTAELNTQWTTEMNMPVADAEIEVLTLRF